MYVKYSKIKNRRNLFFSFFFFNFFIFFIFYFYLGKEGILGRASRPLLLILVHDMYMSDFIKIKKKEPNNNGSDSEFEN